MNFQLHDSWNVSTLNQTRLQQFLCFTLQPENGPNFMPNEMKNTAGVGTCNISLLTLTDTDLDTFIVTCSSWASLDVFNVFLLLCLTGHWLHLNSIATSGSREVGVLERCSSLDCEGVRRQKYNKGSVHFLLLFNKGKRGCLYSLYLNSLFFLI